VRGKIILKVPFFKEVDERVCIGLIWLRIGIPFHAFSAEMKRRIPLNIWRLAEWRSASQEELLVIQPLKSQ
jgi:hypothetical protein